MERSVLLMVLATALLALTLVEAKGGRKVGSPSPAPAPAPAPDYVNLTHILTVAGPFSTFLSYLESTKVIDTFQNQANNSQQGITIFVPTDAAFSSQKSPSLKNLTADQIKSICLFHGLPKYYSLSDFTTLSQQSPVTTFAGGQYTLNFTDLSGTVHIGSGWSNTKVSSSVISTSPVAVYEVGRVLLPEAIFGTDIPPTPAPAPAPAAPPASDSPADATTANSPSSPSPSPSPSAHSTSSAHRTMVISSSVWSSFILAVSGMLVLLL